MSAPIDLETPPASDEPDTIRAARSFLSFDLEGAPPKLPAPLPVEVGDALVEALVRRGGNDDGARLGLLAASEKTDKALAKKARRAIHILRTRGVAVAVPRPLAAAPQNAPLVEEVVSLESVRHRAGDYYVWYVRTASEGGVEVFEGHCSDEQGMVRFRSSTSSRKNWRGLAGDLQSDRDLRATSVPAPWARWLLEEAYQVALRAGLHPPREYAELRHQFAPTAAPPAHPMLALVDERAVAAAGPPEQALDLPETRSWTPDSETLQKADFELNEIVVSPLNVDERMRDQRLADALKKLAARWLDGPNRARLERALLETAYLIHRNSGRTAIGEAGKRDRFADAALCVKASRHVADSSIPPEDNRVAGHLFARLLQPAGLPHAPLPSSEPPHGGLILP